MKKLFSLLLALLLTLSVGSALATTPTPISTVSPEQIQEPLAGQHHYLLLCVDQWDSKGKVTGNTDGIVLVTLDTIAHRIMLTSFARDSLVVRPDGVIGRINYIAKNFSPEDLCAVISSHLGVKVEKYILFDFGQVREIVDYLGGVDITINASEARYLTSTGYVIGKSNTTPVINGSGTYHFNGYAAVIYMRIRKNNGGDLMRTQRVRTVLSTLADQCRNITYDGARGLVDNVLDNATSTNMSLEDMLQAMEQAYGLRGCTMEELRLPIDGSYKGITYVGMSVHDIDWAANRASFLNYLENSFLVRVDEFGGDDFIFDDPFSIGGLENAD